MINIGDVLNDEFIETLIEPVQIQGYEDTGSWDSEFFCKHYSCNGDKNGDFYEAMQNITDWHRWEWESEWEFSRIYQNIEGCIKRRLEGEGFYHGSYEFYSLRDGKKSVHHTKLDIDTTKCGHHLELEPTIVSELNEDKIEQCLRDAAHDIGWLISESWQIMLQTTIPCEWDNRSPREWYGNGWIADPKTRLIIMEHGTQDDMQFKRCLYRRHTLDYSHGYMVEYDRNGDEYYDKSI